MPRGAGPLEATLCSTIARATEQPQPDRQPPLAGTAATVPTHRRGPAAGGSRPRRYNHREWEAGQMTQSGSE